jgi:hypothetical protein
MLHFFVFAVLMLVASAGAFVGEWGIKLGLAGFFVWLYQRLRKELDTSCMVH